MNPDDIPQRTPTTSETLLRDAAADGASPRAEEFASLYEPVLRRYAASVRPDGSFLQPADRDDLVQEVFLSVRSALPDFHYDRSRGRFRDYLKIAVRNAASHIARRPNPVPEGMADDRLAPDPHEGDSAETLLRIWTLALERVFRRGRFSPNAKAVFRRVAVKGESVAVVAREFKMEPNAIYQLRSRVMRAVRDELKAFGHGRLSADDLLEALLAAEQQEAR